MATVEECRTALSSLVDQLAELDPATRRKHVIERTVGCRVTDLDVTFTGRIHAHGADGMAEHPGGGAPATDIRFTIGSDDLVAFADGRLDFGRALLTGRIKVEASFGDLLRLRKAF
ncbi:hypothetical protein [Rhizohabitans arisaemae]|uniref:hypothetical protein n=1 Tax=Rhizohabitans arisaemae TaxID=2720610 RepID=UPI0024B1B97F|nr:hypothetical protein [Rhizohabitans arisaemae]